MNNRLTAAFRMVPMTLAMGSIFLLSNQPGDSFSLPPLPEADKLAHMAVYGVLAATVLLAFGERQRKKHMRRVCVLTILFCLLYGISDEYHQSFVPCRSVSALDVLADCCGAAMTCILWLWWKRKKTAVDFRWD